MPSVFDNMSYCEQCTSYALIKNVKSSNVMCHADEHVDCFMQVLGR
jgi:hypothetical protein